MHENMKTSMWHTGRSERTCRLPACYHGNRRNGVRLYDGHRGNSGDGNSIHSSTAVAVTELMVDALFIHGLK